MECSGGGGGKERATDRIKNLKNRQKTVQEEKQICKCSIAMLLERLTANAEVTTVQGLHPPIQWSLRDYRLSNVE